MNISRKMSAFRASVLLLLLLFARLSALEQSPPIKFDLVPPSLIEQRLKKFDGNDLKRQATLKALFLDAGCKELTEQRVKGLRESNVICTSTGNSDAVIVVGAHFDHVDRGSGVVDNWSGASLLPSLLQSISKEPRRHTFVFIGFAGEEQGEVGSHFYVASLTLEENHKIEAMINMDTLGLGPSEVWTSHADPTLVRSIAGIAKSLKLPVSTMNVEAVGSTDSEQFRNKKIPAITIHSLTNQTLPVLHSRQDTIAQIKLNDYYDTYKLIAGFLAYLDLRSASLENPEPH